LRQKALGREKEAIVSATNPDIAALSF